MDTLSEVMDRLRTEGYEGDWSVVDGALRCSVCAATVSADDVVIDEVDRFEGRSNPDDESVLFALTGPCGHRGLYVAPYGPDATPGDVEVMTSLHRRSR